MKWAIEYPWLYICNKEDDEWSDITMYDLSFDTKFHYFKNHGTDYEQLLIKVFGFGIRLIRQE